MTKKLDRETLRKEAEIFLNELNEELIDAKAGMGMYIDNKDETSTWYFSEDVENMYLMYALLTIQLSKELDVNMFEFILNTQTRLADVYKDEYTEYADAISKLGK